MNYWSKMLQKREYDNCPLPLWKLMITDEEFKELRDFLKKRASITNLENPFSTVCKESALFFAEYWRRMYEGGKHSKRVVYKALGTTPDTDLCNKFYLAACHGAKLLNIETYNGKKSDTLDDLLYQGGLPMRLVTENEANTVWDRFTRGLVNRHIDFQELNLGVVAANSQSLNDFCNQLIRGIEKESHSDMPFYCEDENNVWFLHLKELAKQEKNRRRQFRPFSLEWEFRIDTVERRIYINYLIKGLQRLPRPFLEEQGLDTQNFFSIQVRRNGQAEDSFDYTHNFCHSTIVSRDTYKEGDYITLFLHNQEDAHIGDCLDMSVPHLLYRNEEGKFVLGNQIGREESLILIPAGWSTQSDTDLNMYDYVWATTKLKGLHIPADYKESIVLTGEDGTVTFGINTPLYWTELRSHPLYIPDVVEPLYDASRCRYALCYDTEEGTDSRTCRVQYRNKWNNEWSDVPSYGEIFARAIDPNGNYVTPLKLINIGDGLTISLQHADENSCKIRVGWKHGRVSTTEGKMAEGDVWEIRKEDCRDPRKIRFSFIPDGNGNNQFDLLLKAPFKDFSIKDIYGDDIDDNCWIPYSDMDKYQYHLVGQDIRYTYGNVNGTVKRALRWENEKLSIVENGKKIRTIPYEGSLLSLFDSREVLHSLLERTSQNMLHAEIKVQFTLSDETTISFAIKESPFRPKQTDDGRVVITGYNREPIKFTDGLKLLKLDDPDLAPIEISVDHESGYYVLPEEIRPWGKSILIGRTRGRICPALIDLSRKMDGAYRANGRENAIATITENLGNSKLGDDLWKRIIGWFNRSQTENIPASSILELYCTAQNPKTLLCLTFLLYVKCSNTEERDLLKEKLKTFSNDLAFQWYWLQPHLSEILKRLEDFMPDVQHPAIQEIYIKWAINHKGDDMVTYMSALNDETTYTEYLSQCLIDVITSYTNWIKEICISSMLDAYDSSSQGIIQDLAHTMLMNPNGIRRIEIHDNGYIEVNQNNLGNEAEAFFNKYTEPGKKGNELWLYKRVNAVVAHIRQKIDLFAQQEEIRRSIIFCCKSSNKHFITLLNNKLSLRL